MLAHSSLGALRVCEGTERRQRIRGQVRAVLGQLEEVLAELKDVARELREVVAQIDELTAGIDLEEDDNLLPGACCSVSGPGPGDLLTAAKLPRTPQLGRLLYAPLLGAALEPNLVEKRALSTPELWVGAGGAGQVSSALCPFRGQVRSTPNGPPTPPFRTVTPWSPVAMARFRPGNRTLCHALCCDDDDDDDCEDNSGGRRSSRLSSNDSVFSSSSSPPPRPLRPLRLEALTPRSARKAHMSPGSRRKTLRNCSTQTVSDKSTQTSLPR